MALTVAVLVLACSGSSPTAPQTEPESYQVTTQWGAIVLSEGECGAVDVGRLVESIEKGYQRARAVVGPVADTVSLAGLAVHARPDLHCAGSAAYGCYFFSKDEVLFRCGNEHVLEHELQHRFCDQLDCPCDCYLVDHSGGFDLNCHPI